MMLITFVMTLLFATAADQIASGGPQGASRSACAPADDERWTPLFNGRDLTGWYTFLQKHGKNQDPDHVIAIEDGSIHLYRDAPEGSTVVMGYIATEKEYGDYHLRLQYRWGAKKFQPRLALKRDAGLYYHLNGPDAVWPRGLQYQIEQTNVGDLIALYGIQLDTTIEPKTRAERMPTFLDGEQKGEPYVLGGRGIAYMKHLAGEFERDGWNTVEIIARGATTTHILNGQVMSKGTNIRLVDPEHPESSRPVTRGRIALEIEAAELYFRKVELRVLEDRSGRDR